MIIESLEKRRSYRKLNKELPVSIETVKETLEKVTELVPDAFDMKSSKIIVVLGKQQDELWDEIYNVFEGKVPREKIDAFKNAYGTILYFYDEAIVKAKQEQFPLYAANFPIWANQASGMLQINIWTALSELNVGANLQHYNPVIDDMVKQKFNVPQSWKLIGQMPFGGKDEQLEPKAKEDISKRVQFVGEII